MSTTVDTHAASLVAFFDHVARDDVAALNAFIGNVHLVNRAGMNAMMVAAAYRAPGALQWCIDMGVGRAGVNKPERKEGTTALMCACQRWEFVVGRVVVDCASCAEMLVCAGADVMVQDEKGRTCLHHAAMAGLDTIVRFLCSTSAAAELVAVLDKAGKTAAEYGCASGMAVGVDAGIVVDAQWFGRRVRALTPKIKLRKKDGTSGSDVFVEVPVGDYLVSAARRRDEATLARFGAYLDTVDSDGRNVLMSLCVVRGAALLQWAIQYIRDSFGPRKLADMLDNRDDYGCTCVHFATAAGRSEDQGSPECMEMVLVAGADVNLVDNAGFAPLLIAAQNGFPDIVRTLLSQPDVDMNVWVDGQDAVRLASSADVKAMIASARALDGHFAAVLHNNVEALPHALDCMLVKHPRTKVTLPMYAAMLGRPSCLRHCVEFMGTQELCQVPRHMDKSVLMCAVSACHDSHADNRQAVREQCLDILLARGPCGPLWTVQCGGAQDTVLHMASRAGYDRIVRVLLRQRGIDPGLRNKDGATAVDVSSTDDVRQVFLEFAQKALSMDGGASKRKSKMAWTVDAQRLVELSGDLHHLSQRLQDQQGQYRLIASVTARYIAWRSSCMLQVQRMLLSFAKARAPTSDLQCMRDRVRVLHSVLHDVHSVLHDVHSVLHDVRSVLHDVRVGTAACGSATSDAPWYPDVQYRIEEEGGGRAGEGNHGVLPITLLAGAADDSEHIPQQMLRCYLPLLGAHDACAPHVPPPFPVCCQYELHVMAGDQGAQCHLALQALGGHLGIVQPLHVFECASKLASATDVAFVLPRVGEDLCTHMARRDVPPWTLQHLGAVVVQMAYGLHSLVTHRVVHGRLLPAAWTVVPAVHACPQSLPRIVLGGFGPKSRVHVAVPVAVTTFVFVVGDPSGSGPQFANVFCRRPDVYVHSCRARDVVGGSAWEGFVRQVSLAASASLSAPVTVVVFYCGRVVCEDGVACMVDDSAGRDALASMEAMVQGIPSTCRLCVFLDCATDASRQSLGKVPCPCVLAYPSRRAVQDTVFATVLCHAWHVCASVGEVLRLVKGRLSEEHQRLAVVGSTDAGGSTGEDHATSSMPLWLDAWQGLCAVAHVIEEGFRRCGLECTPLHEVPCTCLHCALAAVACTARRFPKEAQPEASVLWRLIGCALWMSVAVPEPVPFDIGSQRASVLDQPCHVGDVLAELQAMFFARSDECIQDDHRRLRSLVSLALLRREVVLDQDMVLDVDGSGSALVLGVGSLGEARGAEWNGRSVCAKVLHIVNTPWLFSVSRGEELYRKQVRRAWREAGAQARLAHCPYVVQVLGMATDAHGDRTVLVTERFDMSLAQWVASVCSGLYVDEDVTLDVWTAMVGVCEALNAMHHMGPPMVHCDLKEENVFVHVAVRAGNSRRTMIARAAVGDFGSVVEVDVDTGVGAVGTGVGAVDTGVRAGALPCDGTHEGGPGPVPGPASRVQRPWEGNQFVREPGCDDTASPATDMYAFGIMFARVVCSLFVKDGCRHGRPGP